MRGRGGKRRLLHNSPGTKTKLCALANKEAGLNGNVSVGGKLEARSGQTDGRERHVRIDIID